jgi:hypothetical protein
MMQELNEKLPAPAVVRPVITAEEARNLWDEYRRLCEALLEEEDYVEIQGRRIKKKSAWRKLAKAFNISDRLVSQEVHRDEYGRPIWAAMTVVAFRRLEDGEVREAVGYHEAHVMERCCPAAWGGPCYRGRRDPKHVCCPEGCEGFSHWAHPGDVPALAHTRAKSRAIADLIGTGELAAEEEPEAEAVLIRQEQQAMSRQAAPRPRPQPAATAARSQAQREAQRSTGDRDDEADAWHLFWSTAKEKGLSRQQVFDHFEADHRDPYALRRYAEDLAHARGVSVAQAIKEMTLELESSY